MSKRGMSPKKAVMLRKANGLTTTRLQELRVEKGLSQNDLHILSGVTKRTIQHYEHQSRPIDKAYLETLCRLCLALDCKIEDIVENEELIAMLKKIK